MIVDSASRRCSSSAQQCGRRSLARIQVIDGSRPDSGYVFTGLRGEPVNPNTDHGHWKRLLTDAGLRDGRLHDARHTAATVLLILGVPERAVMGLMGWSTTAMAARYQHVTGVVRSDVARRVGGLIWGTEAGERDGTETGRRRRAHPAAGGPALSLVTARRMRDSNPRGREPNTLSKRAP